MKCLQVAELAENPAETLILGFVSKSEMSPMANAERVAELRDAKWVDTALGALTPVLEPNAAPLLLIGTGDTLTVTPSQLQKVAATVAKAVRKSSLPKAAVMLSGLSVKDHDSAWLVRQLVQWTLTGLYQYDTTKSKKNEALVAQELQWLLAGDFSAAIAAAEATAKGVNQARELGNLPPNVCTPTYLADEALAMADRYRLLETRILEEEQMAKMGMGAFMAVSQGSDQPGKMIVMQYQGAGDGQPVHALVGKGLTFDTGGISIKPAGGMDEMKYDMCGAASVYGTMTALAELGAKVNVVAVIAAAENMPSARATRPGDVVTTMSGKTVEILNTDAEGRLVLCDALTYVATYKPETVVNMATLTGAIVVGLGHHPIGLYSNDEALQDALLNAGLDAWDRAWPMPLWDDYRDELDSPYADLRNIGQGRAGGSITAAMYLAEFTKEMRWAHLDIAGAAWTTAKAGATGRPVSLLTQYLLSQSQA
jgi:leucyl aminopeptidase